MKEAEKASDAGVKWSDNPYTTLWEYVLNYIEPVDYLPSTSSVRYLRTDDQ